jgi:outer membrane beta-barrel protein
LALDYYLSERFGFELSYEKGALKPNDSVNALSQFNGLRPNYNKFLSDTSLNGIWVPFYAKMSFMNRSIVYFDMQFALGLGSLKYENQIDPAEGSNMAQSAVAYNFDFTQQLFFSDHFAIRLDIKNKWSSQQQKVYRLSGSQFSSRDLGKVNQQDTTILLGITYFFGSNQN